MNLGVFLGIGESLSDYSNKGQDELIKDYLLKNYSKHFDKVYVFSYANESCTLYGNVFIIPNRFLLHRYLYCLLVPILNKNYLTQCSIIRGLQLTGGIPAAITKILYKTKITFNYGFEYEQFAHIEKKPVQAYLFKIIETPLLKFADNIIVTAKYLEEKIKAIIPQNTISYLPNGVDTSIFKPKAQKKVFEFLFIGRLEPQKNISALLRAVRFLNKKQRKVLIIGSGKEKKALEKMAELFDINLTIISKIPHSQLSKYYNNSKIFVLPSLKEGQPKVLLEAMSCGLPVIASDIEAHREIIEMYRNGILSETDDVNLYKSIKALLDNKKLQMTMGSAARKTIRERYSQRRLSRREIIILKKLVQ